MSKKFTSTWKEVPTAMKALQQLQFKKEELTNITLPSSTHFLF
jgi:hypothetical protein